MAKLCNYKILLLTLLLAVFSFSQETVTVEGWKYIPQNQEFLDQIETLRATQQYTTIINFAFSQLAEKKIEPLAKVELKLVMAQNLQSLGLNAIAVEYFKEIVRDNPGTFVAQQALLELSNLLPLTPYHLESFKALLNRGAFKEVPKGVDSMIQYFVALDNMKKGEYKWANDNIQNIKMDNYWGQNFEYFKAIEQVKAKDLKKAEETLKSLIEKETTHISVKQNAILQRARILFELKDLEQAEKEYLKYESRGRETGRVLFERALVSYYQKKYAHALGLLESLKSENFKTAFNPDQVILEMMIYRDLCHYPTVKKIAAEFEKKYSFLLTYFKSGHDLTKSQVIKKIIFQNNKYKDSADLVHEIRLEQKDIKAKHVDLSSKVSEKLLSDLKKYESILVKDIDREIRPLLKPIANDFLSRAEEIRLLEYVSGLDEFRIKNIFESRTYNANDSERSSDYSLLYWPVEKEYWWDEFKNYQVLLVDRCDGTPLNKRGKQ